MSLLPRFSSPMRSFSSVKESTRLPVSLRPKDCLLSILRKDKSLNKWFYRWMHDISSLSKETSETLIMITEQVSNFQKAEELKDHIQNTKETLS